MKKTDPVSGTSLPSNHHCPFKKQSVPSIDKLYFGGQGSV